MKYLKWVVAFFVAQWLIACTSVGPFIVEVKTEEPVDTPFIVKLEHKYYGGKGIIESLTTGSLESPGSDSRDYSETKLVYANKPVKFPSGWMREEGTFSLDIRHPHYRVDSQPNVRKIVEKQKEQTDASSGDVYVPIEMIRLDKYFSNRKNINSPIVGNELGNIISKKTYYVNNMKKFDVSIDFKKFIPLLREVVEKSDTSDEHKSILIKTIESSFGN